jgi:hypothetical protein
MSRNVLVLVTVLAVVLLGPASVLAQDITQCYPECYASNILIPGTGTAEDGTNTDPFVLPTAAERLVLRQAMAAESAIDGPGSLTLITCTSPSQCAYILYEYEDGQEVAGEPQPGIPPEVGVKLPFPYLLGGGALVGVLLVGVGVVLWRKGRRRPA